MTDFKDIMDYAMAMQPSLHLFISWVFLNLSFRGALIEDICFLFHGNITKLCFFILNAPRLTSESDVLVDWMTKNSEPG